VAQSTDSLKTEPEEDYSQYGSAEETVKYCTQKVRFLSPTKLISIGYEAQAPFSAKIRPIEELTYTEDYSNVVFHGARWLANAPVISNNRFILNLGASYYESFTNIKPIQYDDRSLRPYGSRTESIAKSLQNGIRTVGLNATAFKPLNEKRFLIFSGQTDFSGNFGWNSLSSSFPNPTLTFAVLYGWKRNENTMLAFGATQTWRGSERIYVPLIMYNKTFNDRWGLEMLLPARAHVRYNFSPKSLLLGGFEIEGNSYQIKEAKSMLNPNPGFSELRRSELKFRLMYEQQLFGFVWLSVQAGWRYNYRFNFSEDRESLRTYTYEGKLGNPFYGGISLNLVSP
jgi:hypothetical protein